ncbi:MAG: hypothetical protein ACRDAM_04245 [Casimicrobium sp.]
MAPTFRKTAAGLAELESHRLGLRAELRRLLILIDGKKSVESLAPFFRANELSNLIDELLQCGAIETTVPITSFLPNVERAVAARPTITDKQLRAAIATAKTTAKAMLGRSAERFLPEFDACKDSLALRVVVSDVQLRLIAERGEDDATKFVHAIRKAVQEAA